jgi:hypothetical protein
MFTTNLNEFLPTISPLFLKQRSQHKLGSQKISIALYFVISSIFIGSLITIIDEWVRSVQRFVLFLGDWTIDDLYFLP